MAPSAVEVETINDIVSKSPTVYIDHNTDDHVAFGGDDQWYYNPSTRRFDLSRHSGRKLIVDADDGIRNHRGVVIDPQKTLLVIIDMQNFFIHPAFREHKEGIKTLQPLLKVIGKCRREGVQIAWLNWGITDHDLRAMPPAVTRGFNKALAHERGHGWHVGLGAVLPEEQGGERCLFKGTWNADIYAPLKAVMTDDDVRFDKARMSGLWSPELDFHRWLRESGKKTLLFAGVNTDQCLLGTLTDAYSWGWDCILIGDCAGTMTDVLGAKEVCDYNVATNMGFVTDAKAFCEAEAR